MNFCTFCGKRVACVLMEAWLGEGWLGESRQMTSKRERYTYLFGPIWGK